MPLSLTGTVFQILPEQTGQGKNGTWRKRDFVLETKEQFPKKVCMTQWGDEIDAANVQEGETLTVHIDIASREFNGRWYTDVKAWKIERGADGDEVPRPSGSNAPKKTNASAILDSSVDDDLPF